MERTLKYIKRNPKDFKICGFCASINNVNNKLCISCSFDKFFETEESIKVWELLEEKNAREDERVKDKDKNIESIYYEV